jgi:hypothetical protein
MSFSVDPTPQQIATEMGLVDADFSPEAAAAIAGMSTSIPSEDPNTPGTESTATEGYAATTDPMGAADSAMAAQDAVDDAEADAADGSASSDSAADWRGGRVKHHRAGGGAISSALLCALRASMLAAVDSVEKMAGTLAETAVLAVTAAPVGIVALVAIAVPERTAVQGPIVVPQLIVVQAASRMQVKKLDPAT